MVACLLNPAEKKRTLKHQKKHTATHGGLSANQSKSYVNHVKNNAWQLMLACLLKGKCTKHQGHKRTNRTHIARICMKQKNNVHIAAKPPRPQPQTEQNISPFSSPAFTITPLSQAHTVSRRPLARTHDTSTKRDRNRFPHFPIPRLGLSCFDYVL